MDDGDEGGGEAVDILPPCGCDGCGSCVDDAPVIFVGVDVVVTADPICLSNISLFFWKTGLPGSIDIALL